MKKIIGEEEVHKLAENADNGLFYDTFESLLYGDTLKQAFNAAIAGAYSEEDTMRVLELACTDFVQRLEDRNALFPIGICIPEGSMLREAFAQGITKAHARDDIDSEHKYLITNIADVAALSCDEDFLRAIFEHPKDFNLEGYTGRILETHQIMYNDNLDVYQEYMEQRENRTLQEKPAMETKWVDTSASFEKKPYIRPKFDETRPLGPLDFTRMEKYAIKIYEGVKPYAENGGRGPLSSSPTAYMMLNTMFFEGVENELERIFEDGKDLDPAALYEADEILDRSLDLFSAMYKYGKRMSEDKVGYRVDRASSAKKIYDEGHTVSSFSTSMRGYSDAFTKKRIALVEVMVRRGTPCADFKEILGDAEYTLSGEREILVAPYVRITSKKPRKPQGKEELILDYDNKPAGAVYEMTTVPQEKSHELTEMEQADFERKRAIFEDEKRREKAASFMAKMMNLRLRHWSYTSQDALQCINRDELKDYIEWKEAFQDVYRYRTRQIMLDIDRSVEEALKKGEPLYLYKTYDEDQEAIEASLDGAYEQEEIEGIDKLTETSATKEETHEETAAVEVPLTNEEREVLDEALAKDKPKMTMGEISQMVEKRKPEQVLSTGDKMLDAIKQMASKEEKDSEEVR